MSGGANAAIIGIRHVPRRPDRRFVQLDNGESFTVNAGILTRAGLRIGLELDASAVEKLREEDARVQAKSAALDMVRRRDFSRHEMGERLRRKGFGDAAIEFAISSLATLGYLSDERFAANFVDSRSRRNPRGRYGLQRELSRKGIDRATIDRTLNALSTADERMLAVGAAEKQMLQYRTLPHDVARRRLHDFLVRRGFDYETVLSVVREVTSDEASD